MLALILSLVVVILDQSTKQWIRLNFYPGESHPVIAGLFNIVYVRNTGAAWGMLGGLNAWLAVVSVAMLVAIVVFRRQFLSDTLVHRVALGLMVGGIVGNLCDRVKWQHVVDFLDFHWQSHHFPSFNVADSAICVGVGLYVLSSFFSANHPLRTPGLAGQNGADTGAAAGEAARTRG